MREQMVTTEPVADRRLREAQDEHEMERLAYVETLDERQRGDLDPAG